MTIWSQEGSRTNRKENAGLMKKEGIETIPAIVVSLHFC